MFKVLLLAVAVAVIPLSARAGDPPLEFSFVPQIHQATAADPQCRTPLGAGWFNYLSNRGTVTSIFPAYLGNYQSKSFFTGPICIQFRSADPRWPTGNVFLWVWGRGLSNNIFAHAFDVQCLQNTMVRRFYGHGKTVDDVIDSTVPVQDAPTTIGNDPGAIYAVSVCRLIEMFYPGRGAWYDYPQ